MAVEIPDTIDVWGVEAMFTTIDSVTCQQGDMVFVNNSQGNGSLAYSHWDFGDGDTSNLTNPTHYYSSPGMYPVTLTVTSTRGCLDTLTLPQAVVVVPNPGIANLTDSSGCIPFNLDLAGVVELPDTSALTWQWSFGDGQTYTGQDPPTHLYSTPGTYTISATATNLTGCADTTTALLTIHGLPPVDAGPNTIVCEGSSHQLQATGAQTYNWIPNASLNCDDCVDPQATPASDTWYTVTGTDVNGCQNRDSVFIRVFEDYVLTMGPGDTLCRGQSAVLQAFGTTHYTWTANPGGQTFNTQTIDVMPGETTLYTVAATDSMQCFTKYDSVRVIVHPIPELFAGNDTMVHTGYSATFNPVVSPDVTSVVWTPTTGLISSSGYSITVQPQFTTTYLATASNEGGCTSRDRVTVTVICDGSNYFVPNTFTPNNDGMNDVFYPRGTGLFTIKSMKIFNRWGEIVYQRNDMMPNDASAGWNGTCLLYTSPSPRD